MLTLLLVTLFEIGSDIVVRGLVTDRTGLPMAQVRVYVKGGQTAVETDEAGRFKLVVPETGPRTIVAFFYGFKSVEMQCCDGLASSELRLVLDVAEVRESVTVAAPRPASPVSTQRLTPLDVVRMPGSQGDALRALQAVPGVVKVDEGAGLFVRGGDTEEVLVTLDGVVVAHPYRYETPTGGLFGTFEPFLLEGLAFSTGGFSARFGNALSAVLDLRGLPRPTSMQFSSTAGLAAASARAAVPIGARGGLRFSGNYSFTRFLFALNGRSEDFDRFPEGWDFNTSAHYDSHKAGSTKVFAIIQRDQVGVEVEAEAFKGFLHSASENRLVSGHWEKSVRGWRAVGALGDSRYTRTTTAGVLDIDVTDARRSWRLDLDRDIGRWTIRGGTDGEQFKTTVVGRVPAQGGDFTGASGVELFAVDYSTWRAGSFGEVEGRVGRLTPIIGARIDHFDDAGATTWDPRASVLINMTDRQRLRAAWGIYHQAPAAEYRDRYRGGSGFDPMKAVHWIGGYEYATTQDSLQFRSEVYYKRYRQLPVDEPSTGFAGNGYGSAYGVDLFGRTRWARGELQASYGWLHARRRWTSTEQHERFDLPLGTWTPDFAIPHSLHLLSRLDVSAAVSVGIGWRLASGRPTTPVIGAGLADFGYEPIYGPINSERLPRYERWDLSLSVVKPLWPNSFTVFFVGVTNLFNRHNFFAYAYSPDFSERRPVKSSSPRTLYFGLSFSR